MPEILQQKIKAAIQREPRFHKGAYEKRACINGIFIYACSAKSEDCEKLFLEDLASKLFNTDPALKTINKLPTNFHEFATFYFENVRKRKVVEQSYKSDLNRYKNHVYPKLRNYQLKSISTEFCQKIIDDLVAAGKEKTAEEIFSMLNGIFGYATDRGLLTINPMKTVIHDTHERQHGRALTLAEEKLLFDATQGTEYQTMFAIALYTGMRPYEYPTATLHGNIIIAQNAKRKNAKSGKVTWKRIPVCPMLSPFLEGIETLEIYGAETMRKKIKTILPNHTLKDLRTTFYTRCETCKVDDKARDEFVGHSSGKLHDSYSDLPDAFLQDEANKIKYPLDITITPKIAPKKDRFALARKIGKAQKPRYNPEK